MKNLPALFAPACLLLLSGCIGLPTGTVAPADVVIINYRVTDPATGMVLAENVTATLIAGQQAEGLGPAVAAAVVGHRVNDTLELTTRLVDVVEVDQLFDQRARIQTYNTSGFAAALGPPVVGMNFTAFGYNATLLAVTPESVTFELLGNDGLRQPFPDLGLTMVFFSQGGDLVKTLEPTPGVVFVVEFIGQLGLRVVREGGVGDPMPAGTYRVLPAANGHLRFAHTAGPEPLLDQDAHITLTVVSLQTAQGAPPVTGGYGGRSSPQLLGNPRDILANATFGSH